MSIKDYAVDMNYTVQEVLKKCKELGIKASQASDILTDENIIILDNSMNLISTDRDIDFNENDLLDDAVEELLGEDHISSDISEKKQKLKKKNSHSNDNNDYLNRKKAIYKSKVKLQINDQADENIIVYNDDMTVSNLATSLGISLPEIIKKLMALGIMLTQNQSVDFETAEILALDYNKSLKRSETQDISNFEEYEVVDNDEDLIERPPVITIMGHVDHGKTTLLDYIRKSKIAEGETGGITQAIGAYQITYNDKKITFVDTPGHEAFTSMRARGTSITDLVIIVVAADDGVMPQTKEAIDHALSAKVPIIVAVNKIDKPGSNPERIMQQMAEINIIPEEWGGTVPFVKLSATTGEGVDKLLETILVIAEMAELKANPKRYALGSVIESRIDKNVGGIVSLLIQNGTLRLGDSLVVGSYFGRVRTLKDDSGKSIITAGASTPVEITGLNGTPAAGDKFMSFQSEKLAREIAGKRQSKDKFDSNKKNVVSFEDLFEKIKSGVKEINFILKCDVRGSEEAVKNSLEKINIDGVKINIIRSGIGTITESDVVLANASNAVIIGFNVIPSSITKEVAKSYNVEIRLYQIIYKLLEEMELAMKGILDPEYEEKVMGTAEIRRLFKFSKVGTIAGVMVTSGVLKSRSKIRIIRDGVIIFDGTIASLQREKDQVKEVKNGFECGVTIDNFNDLKPGDTIETYEMVEIKK